MRHTLRQDGDLWHWTANRSPFFFSGVSCSRRSAIRSLLKARREAREYESAMTKWRATWPMAA